MHVTWGVFQCCLCNHFDHTATAMCKHTGNISLTNHWWLVQFTSLKAKESTISLDKKWTQQLVFYHVRVCKFTKSHQCQNTADSAGEALHIKCVLTAAIMIRVGSTHPMLLEVDLNILQAVTEQTVILLHLWGRKLAEHNAAVDHPCLGWTFLQASCIALPLQAASSPSECPEISLQRPRPWVKSIT